MVVMMMMMVLARPPDGVPPVAARAHVLQPLEAFLVLRNRIVDLEVQIFVVVVRTRTNVLEASYALRTRRVRTIRPTKVFRCWCPRALANRTTN